MCKQSVSIELLMFDRKSLTMFCLQIFGFKNIYFELE